MPETPEQARQFLINIFSYGFVGFGSFAAFFNWTYLYADYQCRKRGENRHVSMVGAIGLLLPIGCLINPAWRIHALWTWLLDPFTAVCVFYLIQSVPSFIRRKSS
ncbi:hypothetical protein EON83_06375 [bacterium]|nr:MAG: hypothetical protein EON83_06375 [bacterium]